MRNLKRVLSLALALVMVLGMMVITTSAADFTDADEITYTEAVEVMEALGILQGYNGAFNPKGNLNRAGAAKLIAFMTMGADADNYLSGSVATFDDVAADHWAAKYIAYCSNLKIINGNGDGTFNPDGNISTVGFGKLVLGAAGIEGTYTGAGWEDNVKKALEDNDLDVVTIDTTDITREEAAALMLAGMKYTSTSAGWAVKSGATTLKTFGAEEYADALIYELTMENLLSTALDVVAIPASGHLLEESYGMTYGNSFDAYGRPGIRYVKAPALNLFYADEYVAKYENSFNKDITDAMAKANNNTSAFTGATYVYNGYSSTGADELTDLYANKTALNGMTVELYNMDDNAKTIERVVVIEKNFAIISEVELTEGQSAGYVDLDFKAWDGADVITYTDDPDSTTDTYDVLCGYAEDTALIVTMGDNSELLAVEEPTAVTGKITKVAAGTYTTTSTVKVGETTYPMNNMFVNGKLLNVGEEGTLYLDAQGCAIGWVADVPAAQADNIVFVVAGWSIVVPDSVDEFGDTVTGGTYNYIQCVNTAGETVTYQTVNDESGKANNLWKVTTSYNTTLKATVATLTRAEGRTGTTAELKATDIKMADGKYFTDDVKFIYVVAEKGDLEVVVKEGVQAIPSGVNQYYIPKAIQNSTNSTVSYVFVKVAELNDAPITASGVIFANESADSTIKVLYTDANGDETFGYEHTVYVDGVKTEVVTNSKRALSGFLTLTEVVEGVYSASAKSAANLLVATDVVNMYNGLLTTGDVEDMAVAGAALVNVSGNTKVPADASKLTTADDVALVLSADGKAIVTIYVTASSRS